MTDLIEKSLAVAAVKFKWQKDEKTYDYFIPDGLAALVKVGDKVLVETKRGETEVEVIAIKDASDKAEKQILRLAPPVELAASEVKPAGDWNF